MLKRMHFLSGKNPTPLLSKFYMFFLLSFLILTLLFFAERKENNYFSNSFGIK